MGRKWSWKNSKIHKDFPILVIRVKQEKICRIIWTTLRISLFSKLKSTGRNKASNGWMIYQFLNMFSMLNYPYIKKKKGANWPLNKAWNCILIRAKSNLFRLIVKLWCLIREADWLIWLIMINTKIFKTYLASWAEEKKKILI